MSAPALNLAQRIEAEHQAAIGAARTAIEHAVECGKLLLEAKAQIGHGGWLPWVEAHLSFAIGKRRNMRGSPSSRPSSQMRIQMRI